MKKKWKWGLLAGGVCLAVAGAVAIGAYAYDHRESESFVVSAGLQHIADGTALVASAPMGECITFDAAWFDGAASGGEVAAITITRLPDVTAGELLLGYGEVSVGQTVRRENLSYLKYQPYREEAEACFSFVIETKDAVAGYELSCALRVLAGVNTAPETDEETVEVFTHAGLDLSGVLEAHDPDGDALDFAVVSYPKNGTLALDGKTGHYVYTPRDGFSGEDFFVWRVQDAYGATGADCRVTLTVHPLATGYYFEDMSGNGAHSAALLVTEQGLLSGQMVGGRHYFHPERTLTRAAFVAILLRAAEVEYPDAEHTTYTDDADIPRGMRGAIAYAQSQGWLGEDTVFRPNDPVTRAEAAQIASQVLQLAAPGYSDAVSDHDSIPVGIADALYAALEGGYLSVMADGSLAHKNELTRAEAALFFARVMEEA